MPVLDKCESQTVIIFQVHIKLFIRAKHKIVLKIRIVQLWIVKKLWKELFNELRMGMENKYNHSTVVCSRCCVFSLVRRDRKHLCIYAYIQVCKNSTINSKSNTVRWGLKKGELNWIPIIMSYVLKVKMNVLIGLGIYFKFSS